MTANERPESQSTCRICGAAARWVFARLGWNYARCSACNGLNKLLTQQTYTDLRPSYDPGPNPTTTSSAHVRSYLNVNEKLWVIKMMMADAPHAKQLLDIGCGAGGYLIAAQELGLKARGVEPSEAHSTIARQLGLDVVSDYFFADRIGEQSVDLVLLSQVIEHIYDPRAFLVECLRVLRPGGILCVITPNADSLLARMCGRYWVMLKPVDHVTLFSSKSFHAPAIANLGLYKVEQSEYAWEPLVSLAAAGRDRIGPLLQNLKNGARARQDASDVAMAYSSVASPIAWNRDLSLTRKVATGLSLPLHLTARATGREATLFACFRRA